jgi:ElaB/YqjD/DUF883 family membrane-anchored ribosome-binding protein
MHTVAPTSSPELDRAFGGMAEKAGSIAEQQVAPALVRAAERGGALLARGAHAVQDVQHQLRDGALRASDRTVGYVREQPVKAMLFAAAGGALLMALAAMASRRHQA